MPRAVRLYQRLKPVPGGRTFGVFTPSATRQGLEEPYVVLAGLFVPGHRCPRLSVDSRHMFFFRGLPKPGLEGKETPCPR